MDEQGQTKSLRERILDSDDAQIREYLLSTMHVNSEATVLAYRDLIIRLEKDKPFLIEQMSRYVRGFAVFASPDMPDAGVDVREMRYFGTLAGDVHFDLKRGYTVVPTRNLFVKYYSSPWQEVAGDIFVRSFDMLHYCTVLTPENPRSFSVFVGQELEAVVKSIGCPYEKRSV